ncbi:uncharacterized membrane protein At1g16860 isoform X2 [Amborella trichopoda]|uniref:uncharacterized membrane protein At1g16860 isoform X2 n=1 Tax=Amborella trichopoda TaxID=13333 RepID=UPI0009BD27D4|nr:uncharacterized membrane protein At1g16860 isoform X2 [Amborella trichopoda]|eukprot:XP_020517445.1 uncharacterized membrane protein At1g16860 isoform X2 [Amborella trichopoda]
MGSRIPSHQLSNGLYVSGRPEQHKERAPTMSSKAVPYTGGDVKKSGELGKMFDIPVLDKAPVPRPSNSNPNSNSGPNRTPTSSNPNSSSGPLRKSSGPLSSSRQHSGSLSLQPTGLITSGPISSGPLNGPRRPKSGPIEPNKVAGYGASITSLDAGDGGLRFKVPKLVVWVIVAVFMVALVVGVFMLVTVRKPIILFVVAGFSVPGIVMLGWNFAWRRKGLMGFIAGYPDAELRGAKNGQYVKVTGRHAADFYISDFQTGLRALVKAGYGAKVASFVKPSTVVDVTKENREVSPTFLHWLAERNLSSDDRVMRLKEGYIKEGSTVSVMGMVQRHDNVLMIIPSSEPISTGCQWKSCLLSTTIDGLVLTCDECSSGDVIIPV